MRLAQQRITFFALAHVVIAVALYRPHMRLRVFSAYSVRATGSAATNGALDTHHDITLGAPLNVESGTTAITPRTEMTFIFRHRECGDHGRA